MRALEQRDGAAAAGYKPQLLTHTVLAGEKQQRGRQRAGGVPNRESSTAALRTLLAGAPPANSPSFLAQSQL